MTSRMRDCNGWCLGSILVVVAAATVLKSQAAPSPANTTWAVSRAEENMSRTTTSDDQSNARHDRPATPSSSSANYNHQVEYEEESDSASEESVTTQASALKPTKYHYYPHNQHIYLLPECAVQQVCNAVYVRLNYTQPLCACPSRYREPCSASLNSDDMHTTELSSDSSGKVLTLIKTCEPVSDMKACRRPRDWSLLALQNSRTGKSHYLVICRCPDTAFLEGPMSHDQPTYASVPGIRVYGMVCVSGNGNTDNEQRREAKFNDVNDIEITEAFPWHKVDQLMKYVSG